MKEVCIVAAIRTATGFIIRGQRHGDCLLTASRIKSLTRLEISHAEQGFVTSRNRFVGRIEGRKLQDAAGIKSVSDEGYVANTLFSEDLY